ncbi:hypothetical protein [Thioalkalivibrio sp. XN279]|uniref:hypothetical protein n=1 Tax=Thioalkalivibrio sp. XN279 TaxID=2714953 RepID=UPI001409E3F3|nr:hypothetical protein [Thioalkalivibrio sp. XN279]NHA14608.1 hypothetical protein [Thioalkalivibrio sp. XN279]
MTMASKSKDIAKPQVNPWLGSFFGIATALGLLHSYPVSDMSPMTVGAVVMLLGCLVYQYLVPICVLNRRAFLSHVTVEESRFRRWFWRGNLLRVRLIFTALFTSLLALLLTAQLDLHEWLVIIVSVPSFLLVFGIASRLWGHDVAPEYRLAVILRIAFWSNLALVSLVVALMQVFWVEVPVSSHLSWPDLLQAAYLKGYRAAEWAPVGWLLGLDSAISAGVWHAIQLASAVAKGPALLLASGLAFAWMALKLGAVWQVFLGIVVLFSKLSTVQLDTQARWVPKGAVLMGFGAALAILYGLHDSGTRLPKWPDSGNLGISQLLPTDPCGARRSSRVQTASQRASEELVNRQAELDARILALLDERIDAAFERTEQAVDSFLDWNFSIEGQYAQLGYLAASAMESDAFDRYMASKVDSYVRNALAPAIADAADGIRGEFEASVKAAYSGHDAVVDRLIQEASCVELQQPAARLEDHLNKSLVGIGVGAGILSTRLNGRMGARMVNGLAMKRAMSAIAAKGATRTATMTTGGAAGLACGPYAIICVPVLLAATWLGTDAAFNFVDESLHREEMREEMLREVEREKVALKARLREAYLGASAQAFRELREYQAARFNIFRDGN